ncbi:MAG: hypothetical protein ACI4GZ_05520 [Ruminococcus sp.]
MKKLLIVSVTLIALLFFSALTCSAQSNFPTSADETVDSLSLSELSESLDLQRLYSSLPADAQKTLADMGIASVSYEEIGNVSFQSVISSIIAAAGQTGGGVFASLGILVAVILIYALCEGFSQSLTGDTQKEVLSVVTALCVACALVVPVTDIIDSAISAIVAASDFMLLYIPVMVAVLVSCGQSLSASGYYSLMIMAAEGISQLSSKFIAPMLNVFLGVSICSTIVPDFRLGGFTAMFSKGIKWLLSFSFTIFSALLTFKTLISTSVDSVSTRAVRYTMSSFIPVVGAALSEAYKTVQGSINILKNGVGVFVIFAVCAVFLSVIVKLLLWIISVSVCKNFAEMISLSLPAEMLSGVSTVLSVLLAVILCIMALFIISTALIITAGRSAV